MGRRAVILTVAIVIDAASQAAAQTRSDAPGDAEGPSATPKAGDVPRKLEKVDVIRTRPANDRRESTTTRIVVSHDEIVRYGDDNLADVLKRLPGITIEGLPGGGSAIRLRGLGNGYTQILLDGEPAPPGFSIETLPPDLIERIEILRAPTADMSAQAIAGTINIVLRKNADRRRALTVSGAEARQRPTYGLDGQLADRAAPWAYTIAASASSGTHDGPSVAEQRGSDTLGNTNLLWSTRQSEVRRSDNVSVTPRLTWDAGGDDSLATDALLRYIVTRTHFEEVTTTLAGAPPTYSADEVEYRFDTVVAQSHAEWRHRFASGASLDLKVGGTYNSRDGDVAFQGFDADGVFILDRTVRSSAADKGFSTSGKYLTPIVEGHTLAFGWDTQYAERDERRLQLDATPGGDLLAEIDERYRSRLWRVAGYGQDEWNITPSWSAYAGLRWEGLDARTTGNAISEVGNRSSVLSPLLQTVWKAPETKADLVRFGLGRTYKAPTTRQLTPRRYVANNNTATTPDYQGNPDLRPELAWGLDLAYEHYFGNSGIASVSAFARRIDDVILDQLANVNGTWITFPENGGRASVEGIELEAKFNLRDIRVGAPNLALRGNLARNWSSVHDVPGPDNRLDRQVPFSGSVAADYVADACPLTFGVAFTYRGGGPVRVAADRSEVLPIRRLLDAYALWKLDAGTKVRFSLQNILRQDYVEATSHFDESGRLDLVTTTPTGTSIRVAVELSL